MSEVYLFIAVSINKQTNRVMYLSDRQTCETLFASTQSAVGMECSRSFSLHRKKNVLSQSSRQYFTFFDQRLTYHFFLARKKQQQQNKYLLLWLRSPHFHEFGELTTRNLNTFYDCFDLVFLFKREIKIKRNFFPIKAFLTVPTV